MSEDQLTPAGKEVHDIVKLKMDEAYNLGITHAIEVAKVVKEEKGGAIHAVLAINKLISKLKELKPNKP